MTLIDQLDVANLRSFEDEHELPLAPITLVYGPNSAGKSTLIQGLAVLKQTIDAARAGSSRQRAGLVLRGGLVDLGGFATAVTGHDLSREMYFGVRLRHPEGADRRGLYSGVGFTCTDGGNAGVQARATVGLGDHLLEFTTDPGGEFVLRDRNAFLALLKDPEIAAMDPERLAEVLEAFAQQERDDARPDGGARFLSTDALPLFPAAPTPGSWLPGHEEDLDVAHWWVDHVYDRLDDLPAALDRLAYLGPMRAAPTRFQTLPADTGSAAVTSDRTTRLLVDDGPGATGKELQHEVNRWLERLQVNYRLAVEPISSGALGLKIGDLVATTLIDARNGIPVTPQDVGYGISQMLPIVVQLLASTESIVCVEQPEVHIHPRLQSRLGDLLIEATDPAGKANQVIVETHSEHLVLRLLKRIRDDDLSPDHVSILYIDTDFDGSADPVHIPISSEGHFLAPWPDGFFDQRREEFE